MTNTAQSKRQAILILKNKIKELINSHRGTPTNLDSYLCTELNLTMPELRDVAFFLERTTNLTLDSNFTNPELVGYQAFETFKNYNLI